MKKGRGWLRLSVEGKRRGPDAGSKTMLLSADKELLKKEERRVRGPAESRAGRPGAWKAEEVKGKAV